MRGFWTILLLSADALRMNHEQSVATEEDVESKHLQDAFARLVLDNMRLNQNNVSQYRRTQDGATSKPVWADIDVVMLAKSVNCDKALKVNALITRLKPRQVFVITREGECEKAKSAFQDVEEGKVKCIDEGSAVDGLSLRTVSEGFETLEHANICSRADDKDKPHAWFLQQFLKLGFPIANHDVSEHFLVWDSDMVIVDSYEYHNDQGQVLFPGGGVGDERVYKPAYEGLMKDQNFHVGRVAHHMMMYKPYVEELLNLFEQADLPRLERLHEMSLPRWVTNAMVASCDTDPQRHRRTGFSEYAFYSTFVLNYHPHDATQGGDKAQKLKREAKKIFGGKGTCWGEQEFNARAKKMFPGYLIVGNEEHESEH